MQCSDGLHSIRTPEVIDVVTTLTNMKIIVCELMAMADPKQIKDAGRLLQSYCKNLDYVIGRVVDLETVLTQLSDE